MVSLRRRLAFVSGVALVVVALGTGWFMLVEGWPWYDALYMTVITLTTVGFGEIHPLGVRSRLFTIALIVMGVGTVAYALSSLGEYLMTAGLAARLRERRLMRELKGLDNHIIICGAGRVGQTAGRTLHEMKRAFVIVDSDQEMIASLEEAGWAVVPGDSTRDDTLLQAGIERAAGLLVCTGNDSNNLFVVLSARTLNPDLFIVARSVDAENESKMRRAGADKVISPYQIGGRHMANLVVRPHVTEFMEVVTLDTGLELWLEELKIGDDSPLAGRTVVEADLRRRTGVTLIALVRGGKREVVTPDEVTDLAAGDELIVLGTRQQLQELETLVGSALGNRNASRQQ